MPSTNRDTAYAQVLATSKENHAPDALKDSDLLPPLLQLQELVCHFTTADGDHVPATGAGLSPTNEFLHQILRSLVPINDAALASDKQLPDPMLSSSTNHTNPKKGPGELFAQFLASLENDMSKPNRKYHFLTSSPIIEEKESSKGKHLLHVNEFVFYPYLSIHDPSSSRLIAGGEPVSSSVLKGEKQISNDGKQSGKSFLSALCGAPDMLDDVVVEVPKMVGNTSLVEIDKEEYLGSLTSARHYY